MGGSLREQPDCRGDYVVIVPSCMTNENIAQMSAEAEASIVKLPADEISKVHQENVLEAHLLESMQGEFEWTQNVIKIEQLQ